MSAPPVSPEQQTRLLAVRQAALLKRYVGGQRLGRGELRELRGVLPDAVTNGEPVQRARYLHPLEHYEAIFHRKSRMLKLWIATGRDATPPELPPFDDPPKMKLWWVRHMSHRVPDDIEQLAAEPSAAPALPADSPFPANRPEQATPASASNGPPSPPPAASHLSGFAAALDRIRSAEAVAGELYNALLKKARDATIDADRLRYTTEAERARRAWDEQLDKLRTYEKDADAILAKAGKSWNSDDVLSSTITIHTALAESIRNLARRMDAKLAALPADKRLPAWLAEVDRMFAELRANRFTAPVELRDDVAA